MKIKALAVEVLSAAIFKQTPTLRSLALALLGPAGAARAVGDCGNRHPTQKEADACAASLDSDRSIMPDGAETSAPASLDLPPDRCVIIPHASEKPGALALDLHSAILAVLQRDAYRDAVVIRDPLDVVTLRRDTPEGPKFATAVRWYIAGEQPIDELLVEPAAPEAPPAALPRMDAGVSYQAARR